MGAAGRIDRAHTSIAGSHTAGSFSSRVIKCGNPRCGETGNARARSAVRIRKRHFRASARTGSGCGLPRAGPRIASRRPREPARRGSAAASAIVPPLELAHEIGNHSNLILIQRIFSMPPAREVELKLEVPDHSLHRLARSSLLQAARKKPSKAATLVSVYFDTDKLKLRNKGLSLRVRRIGRRHVQTIKQETGESAVLFARNEWEPPIGGSQPEFDVAKDGALKPVFSKTVRRGLKPIFETRVRRTVYPIQSGDSEIELTVEKGKVEAGRHSSPLCEVELELKRGESAELFKLARTLAEEVPLQLAVKSKAERGYALIAGEVPEAVKTAPVALAPDFIRQVAFQAIARTCLRHLVVNQAATLRGDPEGVHQMRVALRRMRA